MEGTFACPECGQDVRITGLAPGRRVLCSFCGQVLEVPFLPRATSDWKRKRFTRPRWFVWGCFGLGLLTLTAMTAGLTRFLGHRRNSQHAHAVQGLLVDSRAKEKSGKLGPALVDLDAALDLARQSPGVVIEGVAQAYEHRPELAKRDALVVLESLIATASTAFPLGQWLDLVARVERDRDLEPIVPRVREAFRNRVTEFIDAELAAISGTNLAEQATAAFDRCDRLAQLIEQLEPTPRADRRAQAFRQATRLVAARGVVTDVPRGEFVLGSQTTYENVMLPLVSKTLSSKGYLPYRPTSPWREAWQKAAFRFTLRVKERQEGNYLSSQNRMTRIEVDLNLDRRERQGWAAVWGTMPSARTQAPLPNLPAFLSGRAAASEERTAEFEKLLYNDARGRIDEKVSLALSLLPPCSPATP